MQYPNWIQKGDKISLLATSGKIDPEVSNNAAKQLRNLGFKVEVLQTAISSHNYFSGTPEQRLHDFQNAISDAECKAILCVRGGFGAIHLLDKLDWSGFANSPKWLVGFSDVTLLHATIQKNGFCSLHGAMAKDFAMLNTNAHKVLQSLQGSLPDIAWKSKSIKTGKTKGELVGGNLTLLTSLLGSAWEPEWKGKILFVEDIGEYLYKIDRMLWTLKYRGVFDKISGIILGHFSDISDTKVAYGSSLRQIVQNFFADYTVPIVMDFPAGHESPNHPLILGANIMLDVNKNSSTLTYKL